jgi:F-type H+-transporting ATPase subunit delta
MINKKIARRYSLAIYEIAVGLKLAEKIKKDLLFVKNTIENSRELALFLRSPIINTDKKQKILALIFSKKISSLTIKFINMLTEKNRERFLYDICSDFHELMNEKNNISEAVIKTAVKINETEKKNLCKKLEAYTGKKIHAIYIVDPALKGGFVIQIDDTIIDASIARQLDLLNYQLRGGSFTWS